MNHTRLWVACTITWLAVVGWLTLRSNPVTREIAMATPWNCVLCGTGGATDFALNLLLFAPFGVMARALRWSWSRLLLCAFGLTLSIEFVQGAFLVGRDATMGDVMANTFGAMLGWPLAAWWGSLGTAPRRARATALVVLTCQGLVWFGTGIGMRPVLNGPTPWVGRFSRAGSSSEPFVGSIQQVALDGIAVTMEPLPRLPTAEDTLDLAVALTRNRATVPDRNASIVRLVDATPRVFLRASQVGEGINVEVPLAASRWLLRTPDWRYATALKIPVGTPWQFSWRRHAASFEMTSAPADQPQRATHQSLAVSIGLGWVWVHPFVTAISQSAPWWTALWIATWFALLGWAGSLAGRRFSGLLLVASFALFVGAGVITSLPVSVGEVVAALAGFGVGWLGPRSLRPHPHPSS